MAVSCCSRAPRSVAVFLLICVAVLGIRAREGIGLHAEAHRGAGGAVVWLVLGIVGLVAGTMALAALFLVASSAARRRRRGKDNPPHVVQSPVVGFWGRIAALAVAMVVIGVTVGALALVARGGEGGGTRHVPVSRPPSALKPAPAGSHGGGPAHFDPVPVVLAAALTVLLTVAVLVLVRLLRTRSAAPAGVSPGRLPGAAGAAGALAPQSSEPRDARGSVIANYAAMERELARASVPRNPADTPQDLLDRALAKGFDTSTARVLASLYSAARFSSRPVTAANREQARLSLARVCKQWSRREERW